MDRIQVLAESGGIPVENVRFIWNLALEEAARVADRNGCCAECAAEDIRKLKEDS